MHPPWGSLTGIRPTRLVYARMQQGRTLEQACQWAQNTFDLTAAKTDLLYQVVQVQQSLPQPQPQDVDIYIASRFAPRAAGIAALSARRWAMASCWRLYQALLAEMDRAMALVKRHGLRVRAFYRRRLPRPGGFAGSILQSTPVAGGCPEATVGRSSRYH